MCISTTVKNLCLASILLLCISVRGQGLIQGPLSVCSFSTVAYFVQANANYEYAWQVQGGSFVYGATADSALVRWERVSSGRVTITAKDKITGKTFYDTVWANIDTSCVWPGDANHDHNVSYTDILSIGEAYGRKHNKCADTSTVWEGQPRCSWQDTIGLKIDMKHSDCNGDGIVDSADAAVVIKNYMSIAIHKALQLCPPTVPGDPELTIYSLNNTIHPGDTIHKSIYFGSSIAPVLGAYGVAFSIIYDPDIVDSKSIKVDLSNQWIGQRSNTPPLLFYKVVPDDNRIDIAISRTDHSYMDGFGEIANLNMLALKNIPPYKSSGKFTLGEFQYISSAGGALSSLARINDSFKVVQSSGIASAALPSTFITISPNPAKGFIHIECKTRIHELSIFNSLGQEVYNLISLDRTNQIEVNTSPLPPGIYFAKVKDAKGAIGYKQFINISN